MRSSTSASEPLTANGAIALLVCAVLAYFLVAELAMRTAVPRFSEIQRRETHDRNAALAMRPRTPDGAKTILLVGNSLLLNGVEPTRMQEVMGSDYHTVVYPVEATTYLDWYFGLRRLFAEGSRPAVVVLTLGTNHVLSDATNGEGFAHSMMSLKDLPAVVRDSHLNLMTASSYFFANLSALLGERAHLHNGLLSRWLPNAGLLAGNLAIANPAPPPAGPVEMQVVIRRLQSLRRLCAQYQATFVFLIPPTLNHSDPAELVRASAADAGIPVLVPYAPEALPAADFSDGYHLNTAGAALFTERSARELHQAVAMRAGD